MPSAVAFLNDAERPGPQPNGVLPHPCRRSLPWVAPNSSRENKILGVSSAEHFLDLYFASSDFKIIKYNERGMVAERAMREVPAGPTGVAMAKFSNTAMVHSRFDRSISQLSLEDFRHPQLVRTQRLVTEPWSSQEIRGAILFHNTRDTRMTANRWISCGVCHLDGGLISDGAVWDLTARGAPPKLSNTMDLVTTVGTSPPFFHRGTSEVVSPLERFVHIFHAGTGFLANIATSPLTVAVDVATPHYDPPVSAEWDRPSTTPVRVSSEWEDLLAYMQRLRPRPNPHRHNKLPRAEIREPAAHGHALFLTRTSDVPAVTAGPTGPRPASRTPPASMT